MLDWKLIDNLLLHDWKTIEHWLENNRQLIVPDWKTIDHECVTLNWFSVCSSDLVNAWKIFPSRSMYILKSCNVWQKNIFINIRWYDLAIAHLVQSYLKSCYLASTQTKSPHVNFKWNSCEAHVKISRAAILPVECIIGSNVFQNIKKKCR